MSSVIPASLKLPEIDPRHHPVAGIKSQPHPDHDNGQHRQRNYRGWGPEISCLSVIGFSSDGVQFLCRYLSKLFCSATTGTDKLFLRFYRGLLL